MVFAGFPILNQQQSHRYWDNLWCLLGSKYWISSSLTDIGTTCGVCWVPNTGSAAVSQILGQPVMFAGFPILDQQQSHRHWDNLWCLLGSQYWIVSNLKDFGTTCGVCWVPNTGSSAISKTLGQPVVFAGFPILDRQQSQRHWDNLWCLLGSQYWIVSNLKDIGTTCGVCWVPNTGSSAISKTLGQPVVFAGLPILDQQESQRHWDNLWCLLGSQYWISSNLTYDSHF